MGSQTRSRPELLRDEASREIFAFIEGFYNRQRLHQSLGYLSPLSFERRIGGS